MLSLVEDHVVEADLLEELLVASHQRIAGDDDVELVQLLAHRVAVGPMPDHRLERGRELLDLHQPVRHDRGRRDHDVHEVLILVLGLEPEEQRDRLDRLTEAHVVGQDATGRELVQETEPGEALALVRPQVPLRHAASRWRRSR